MTLRAPVVTLVAAVVLAAVGVTWEISALGLNDAAAARRLEGHVRRRVEQQAGEVRSLAERAAADPALVAEARATQNGLSTLFVALGRLAQPGAAAPISVAVYAPSGPAGEYRILAWSDGPAADLGPERLAGDAAVFVAPGSAGMHLVYVQPIEREGRRVGVAAATSVLSPATESETPTLDTGVAPVTLIPRYFGAGDALSAESAFVIAGPTGAPLVEAHFSPADLESARRMMRRRTLALALVPLSIGFGLLVIPIVDRRRGATSIGAWLGWSACALGVALGTTAALAGAATLAGAPAELVRTMVLAGMLGAATLAGGVWWRRTARNDPRTRPVRFVVESLVAGGVLALGIATIVQVLRWRIGALSFDAWHSALFPFDGLALLDFYGLLLAELIVSWVVASVLALVSLRWRRSPVAVVGTVALWALPSVVVLTTGGARVSIPPLAALVIVAVAIAFGLAVAHIRRGYRRATESRRLGFGLLALVTPLLAAYPLSSVISDETTRRAIESTYAPATARHPEQLREALVRTQREIDAMPGLAEQLRVLLPGDNRMAFTVWNQTSLSDSRVSSDVELYGPDRQQRARFSLNLSDYLYRTRTQTWSGTGCSWDLSGEVVRVGASDRPMLHAERGVCDASGAFVGAIVIHAAPTDYQALSFVSSPNPYREVFRTGDAGAEVRPERLQLVVYGWSFRPLFVSNPERTTWSLAGPIGERLYRSRDPFWTTLTADERVYDVYFSQNRAGIYALGFAPPTLFEHLTRIAEVVALTAVLFIAIEMGAALVALAGRRKTASLRYLFHEVRTSFYRKLFLFFVFVAVGPVLLFAFAFGAYMTTRLRTGVEEEAKSVVTVARRVFDEVAGAGAGAGTEAIPPTDDVMVWIRQVIGQDVNLFDGASLTATSQRDLFNSGLLETRTPASVYRAIALDRRPSFVTEGRLGSFAYLVAAAPVGQPVQDAMLVVPLAPRQREIERELDELYRGVLVGAVFVVLVASALGASLAGRVSDPVARLTEATRRIAAGRLDARVATDTADELRRLVDGFNSMAETLVAQRAELARTNQLKAWNDMARQVAHEIKNPLTPIQLSAEHLQRVHADNGRPLGATFDQCLTTILGQVRLLRQIASEFANFASEPVATIGDVDLGSLVESVIEPYRTSLAGRVRFLVEIPVDVAEVRADRTLLARALTNVVENAVQAMPSGGDIRIVVKDAPPVVTLEVRDSGVGMDAAAVERAFEPYFSTKTGGSGLGLANARRNLERQGAAIGLTSQPGEGTVVRMTLVRAAVHPGARESS